MGLTLSTLLVGCATGGDPFGTGGSGGTPSTGGGGDGGDPSNGGNTNVTTDDSTTTKTATVTSTNTSTNTSTGSMGCSGFQCANGQCINAAQECDNTVHCADGSDEAPYNAACPSTNTTTTTGGGACDPFFEFTCNSGECLPIFFICDGGLFDCADGSDEDTALCGSGGTTAPPEWTCDPTYYDAGDGCDCGCGAIDLDCASSNVDACDYCDNSGSCSTAACPGDIDPTNNATCP